jgi:hypothetical protein
MVMMMVVVVTEMMVVVMVMMVPHHAADDPAHPMVVMMVVVVHLCELHIVSRRGIGAGLIDRQQQRSRVGNRLQQVGERIGPENV